MLTPATSAQDLGAGTSFELRQRLLRVQTEMATCLSRGIIPFWIRRAPDLKQGGFFTEFDGNGERVNGGGDKCLVTQARLLWFFATMAPATAGTSAEVLEIATRGFRDLVATFHDGGDGGWWWRVARDGEVLDRAKVVYGQSFALYGLAAFARATRDQRARSLACNLFDTIVSRAADTTFGGYREVLEPDGPIEAGTEIKTLDTHMHLLESFAELVRLTGNANHVLRLREVRQLIVLRMIDPTSGAGGTQYTRDLQPRRPVVLPRTWIAERPAAKADAGSVGSNPSEGARDGIVGGSMATLTSYGHNLELAWLLRDADQTLGEPGHSDEVIAGLARHALMNGFDHERGGVFREGPAVGAATDRDKEFWQNAEALVGFLEGFRVTGDDAFLDAFLRTWAFAKDHLVHPEFGEWRVRVTEAGEVVDDHLGNEWKNAYHTGRALLESLARLDALVVGGG